MVSKLMQTYTEARAMTMTKQILDPLTKIFSIHQNQKSVKQIDFFCYTNKVLIQTFYCF